MSEDKPDKTYYFVPIKLDGDKADGGVDVVTYYADFGLPYKEWIRLQSLSVRRVMPDARRVLMTPNAIELSPYFEKLLMMDFEPNRKTLMADRCMSHIRWAMGTKRRTIFCDCDLEFLNPPVFDGTFDIGLLWRKRRPDQPVNSSMILAEPGFHDFWTKFAEIVVNTPAVIKEWWCDQISLAILIGSQHQSGDVFNIAGARVKLFDSKQYCDTPELVKGDTWAIHRKGAHKGEWFYTHFNQMDPKDGTSLGGSHSSTDTPEAPK